MGYTLPTVGTATATGLSGDFSNDGAVDTADHVMWRSDADSFGSDPAGYHTWRANFWQSVWEIL